MRVALTLYAGNSTRIELEGLGVYSAIDTYAYANSATVTATLVDSDGDALSGVTWPLTLAYEADSDGNYSGVVAETLSVSAGDSIVAQITATDSGEVGYWEVPVVVEARTHRSGYG